ncbi:hypothetical protein MJO29_005128, partial [Puccinia striiformis f. sp. tritici]
VQQDGQQTSFEGMTDIEIESLPGEQDFDIDSVDMREVINIFHPSAPDKREEDGDGEQGEEEGDDDKGGVDDGDDTDGQGWFPFGGVLQIVSILLAGFMHNILSRMQYDKVRALMGLLGLNLLHWTSIWRAKAKLRAMLNMEPLRRESVFKNQCYSLSIKRTTALVLSIDCEEFSLNYSEICLWGGLKLTPICKNTPWDVISKGFIDILKDRQKKHEKNKILAIAEHEYI